MKFEEVLNEIIYNNKKYENFEFIWNYDLEK